MEKDSIFKNIMTACAACAVAYGAAVCWSVAVVAYGCDTRGFDWLYRAVLWPIEMVVRMVIGA